MQEISCQYKRSCSHDCAQNPISMSALRIECVHAFFLERRHYVILDGRNRNVEPIAQIGDVSLRLSSVKEVLHHRLLKRSKIVPLFGRLELNEDVVLPLE